MDEYKKKPEPKKIRLLPVVDRSSEYDTLSFEGDTLYVPDTNIEQTDENNRKNNSQSVSKLES